VSETALVDTGFWIALFDPRDEHHDLADSKGDLLDLVTVVVPWPTLYETLRTRFVRRPEWVLRLDQRLKRPTAVEFVDDRDYRDEAYALAVEYSIRQKRPISMVDMLLRLLIDDPGVRVDYLFTTNPRDFRELCVKQNVTLV